MKKQELITLKNSLESQLELAKKSNEMLINNATVNEHKLLCTKFVKNIVDLESLIFDITYMIEHPEYIDVVNEKNSILVPKS